MVGGEVQSEETHTEQTHGEKDPSIFGKGSQEPENILSSRGLVF